MLIFSKLEAILAPTKFPEPIKDPTEIASKYKYWRTRTVYSLFIGYAVFYFSRKSLTFALPLLAKDLNYSMSDIGILSTVLYVTYGVSKFLSGVVSDRSNPRYFMAIGLFATGLFNLLFGFSSNLSLFVLFWGLNGLFQGWGWPPVAKQLTHWFEKENRGLWWSMTSTSHNVGGAIIPLIGAFACTYLGWRYALIIPGIIAMLISLWLVERLRDIPQSLGLPPVPDDIRPEMTGANSGQQTLSAKQILFDQVMSNKSVWILSFSYFCVYTVRMAMADWGALYFINVRGFEMIDAAKMMTSFEIGGFCGVLFAGWASDYFWKGRRIPYMSLCSLAMGFMAIIFWNIPTGHTVWNILTIGVLGFLVFGPQLLIGLAASEFVDKKASGTANGFAGCFAYLGAAMTGYPLGKLIDLYGWDSFFGVIIFFSFATFLILAPMWVVNSFKTQRVII